MNPPGASVPAGAAVLSPLSAYLCLAMLMPGANENTKAEFEKILGADWDYVSALAADIAARPAAAPSSTLPIPSGRTTTRPL